MKRGFFFLTLIQIVQSMTYYYCQAARAIFSLRNGVLLEASCLSQEALYKGAAVAQAVHICCH